MTLDGEVHGVGVVVEVDRPRLSFGERDGDALLFIGARVETVAYDSTGDWRPDVPVREGKIAIETVDLLAWDIDAYADERGGVGQG